MNADLQKINNAIIQLNRVEESIREMIKRYIGKKLVGATRRNPMKVDITIMPQTSEVFDYAPNVTNIWIEDNDIYFMIDDVETNFDSLYTYEIQIIANEI